MKSDGIAIRLLGPGDEALVASATGLFDHAPIADQTRDFLASAREFLWFAMDDDKPVGFVSATSILHPDKQPHLFVNELTTHADYRRRGIARRLMEAVEAFARAERLRPVWVVAEGDDEQAIAFYRSLGGMTEAGAVFFESE